MSISATASVVAVPRSRNAALAAFAVGVVPAALAAANGGYFPTSWGWAALAFAWIAALAVLAGTARRLPALWLALPLLALAVLSFVSAAWSAVPSASFSSGEEALVIALGTLAVAIAVGPATVQPLALGLVAGDLVISLYALATRLIPGGLIAQSISGNRLYRPIGYWNGLGVYAVVALLVAAGLLVVVGPAVRAALAAAIPVFAVTAYFTYSRGSAIVCGVGLCIVFALARRRTEWLLRAALAAIPAAVAVLVASRSSALTTAGARSALVSSQGHRLALVVLVLAAAAAVLALVPARLVTVPARADRVVASTVAIALVAAIAAGLVAIGGPRGIWDKFKAPPPATHGNLNNRLFSFSGSARTPLWTAAVHQYEAHPVAGAGAGSYESYYLRTRTTPSKVRNAHNLYLETLAELGPLGLALLLVALLSPFVAAVRARRHPLTAALAAGYAALVVHLLVDWDWQLPGVALTALACGAGLLILAGSGREPTRPAWSRGALLALSVAGVAASFVMLTGNLYLGRATSAAQAGNWTASAHDARKARGWQPWSADPWRVLGEAQLALGNRDAAIASFHHAAGKSGNDWNVWFDLARATTGKEQQTALARASKLNPLSPEVAELRRELAADKQIVVTGS